MNNATAKKTATVTLIAYGSAEELQVSSHRMETHNSGVNNAMAITKAVRKLTGSRTLSPQIEWLGAEYAIVRYRHQHRSVTARAVIS